jgi:hypothetical protein
MQLRVLRDGWYLLLVVAAATTVTAQSSVFPASSMFRVVEGSRNLSTTVGSGTNVPNASSEASLPDAPSAVAEAQAAQSAPVAGNEGKQLSPQSPTTGSLGLTFIAANGMLLGSTIANAEVIARCRPSSCRSVPDSIRSRGALYGIGIPASLGISYVSYRIKRGGSRWWIVPVAVFTAGNVAYAVHASQWTH